MAKTTVDVKVRDGSCPRPCGLEGRKTARAELARRAGDYMATSLRIQPSPEALDLLSNDPEARIVEFAHTPHFGHMGLFRMLLAACQVTLEHPKRVLVFFVNDHVRANAFRFIRHIPMERDGVELRGVPGVGIPKKLASKPLRYVPSPTAGALLKSAELVAQAVLFDASRALSKAARRELRRVTDARFHWLVRHAEETEFFSEWAARALLSLVEEIWGDCVRILVVPSTALAVTFPEGIRLSLARRLDITAIQNRYARGSGDWPASSAVHDVSEDYLPFHVLCPVCRDVGQAVPDGPFDVRLTCHGQNEVVEAGDARIAPKVVVRQPLANLLDIEYRVCGNPLGYWGVADEVSRETFNAQAPERYPVTGNVGFHGVSGRQERAALLRVLSECSTADVARQLLVVRTSEELLVRSPFLNGSK